MKGVCLSPSRPVLGSSISMNEVRDDSPRTRVYRAVKGWVQEGKLSSGERLPAEESLAEMFDVSRGTVRSALKLLEEHGVLQARKHHRRTIGSAAAQGAAPTGLLGRTCVILSEVLGEVRESVLGYDNAVQVAIGTAVQRSGLNLLSLHPSSCTADGIQELIRAKPMGLLATHAVCLSEEGRRVLGVFRDGGVPVVAHSDHPDLAKFDRVSSDSSQGTADLVHWLSARGHRRILRVWTERHHYWLHERDRGFARACSELAIPELPPVHIDQPVPRRDEMGEENLRARTRMYAGFLVEHLQSAEPPDALIATSDADTFALIAACRLFNRTITVVGYDDYWEACWERPLVSGEPAASVEKDNDRIGEAMLRLLAERVAGMLPSEPQHVTIPQRVVANTNQP